MARIYLIGAGPGDPELLTIKAIRTLECADIVLYDKLVNINILSYAKKEAIKICVGKENGFHSIEQDDINSLMLTYYNLGFKVARLKSGDPFVFGRGAEEALFLRMHNVEFEIIPGITSAIGLPTHACIPVTYRGLSSSFAVITGHRMNGSLEHINWHSIVGIDTLIFLMAVSSRQEIAKRLIGAGRDKSEPVAFIENGFCDDEKIVVTTLESLAYENIEIKSPSVMVIGKVVNIRNKLKAIELALSSKINI